jgi:hypothetical protein
MAKIAMPTVRLTSAGRKHVAAVDYFTGVSRQNLILRPTRSTRVFLGTFEYWMRWGVPRDFAPSGVDLGWGVLWNRRPCFSRSSGRFETSNDNSLETFFVWGATR